MFVKIAPELDLLSVLSTMQQEHDNGQCSIFPVSTRLSKCIYLRREIESRHPFYLLIIFTLTFKTTRCQNDCFSSLPIEFVATKKEGGSSTWLIVADRCASLLFKSFIRTVSCAVFEKFCCISRRWKTTQHGAVRSNTLQTLIDVSEQKR